MTDPRTPSTRPADARQWVMSGETVEYPAVAT